MIPRSWLIIGALAALAGSNAFTGCAVREYYTTQAEAERARAKSDALEEARRREIEQAAETARRDAETRDRDAEHAKNIAAITAAADASAADYGRRLRALQNGVASCRAAAAPVNPGLVEGGPARGDDGRASALGSDLAAFGRDYNKLAETVKTCVGWAAEVGR